MRAAFFTLGCKVNQYETSVIIQLFSAAGFDIVEPDEDADVYVVNSCTVTQTGDKKSRRILRRFRRQNPTAIICLCGCFPQAFPDDAAAIPEADIIMGQRNRAGLLAAVQRRMAVNERIIDITPHEKGEEFEKMSVPALHSHTRAFMKIQDGCERYCSYCIIPKARGAVRSKRLEDIKTELEEMAANGHKEVVLVGINLSSYGADISLRLIDAVKLACSVKGIERVRLGSLEPELLSPEDIAEMGRLDSFCPQFHLALQSGCDKTLQSMRRHYNTAEYKRIVDNLLSSFENPSITTDIMVGFPGETEEDHRQSMTFAKEIGFAKMHVFAYSQRPGTTAASLPNQISNSEKNRRSREMMAVADKCRAAFLAAQVGKTASVLFEQKENGLWHGYSRNYTPVAAECEKNIAGEILPVSLTGALNDSCTGWLETASLI